jgi:hypothetical protein
MRKQSPRIDPARITSSSPAASQISRRRFVFALSAGSAGAVAAAASPALAKPAEAAVAAPGATTSGYRETDHVRDYYATTRL